MDGVQDPVTLASAGNLSGNQIVIGAAPGPGFNNPWNGYIDDVSLFSRALTAAEVSNLYASSSVSNGVAGRVYRANATNHIFSDGFVGFAAANTLSGNTGNVIINGLANVSIGLNAGKQYYLGTSPGTVSTVPGSVIRKVGIATETSTLLITNIW